MRFHISILAFAALAGHSYADKSGPLDKSNATVALREQNRLTISQMPPACNLAACLGLSGTASCVVSAISSGDPAALQRCLVNGLAQICSCAACVPLVDNFLISLGVCVSKPGGNETVVEHVPEAVLAYFEFFMKKTKADTDRA
ncbi:hypothetical protein N7509_001013 [Penicillium cosmopolitanum]|uniref:Fungal calcium binding protein domain-containing protein n=1 Tax=Penicillium cosmopolitanum TaxID=1131564 RepID=A0A9W9WBM2_9EURO|nr:uncharacterized protein N7509_001013 [Penicillium cosmopolitanum]KAJ5414386.1 hypothetical protein N7509_001013 [Penicillium cosmopolitanum]